ncbi:hypothetical protein [Capnocytophaga granulosa]|uniref:hypothetical protein n=1 Tax=Capnocytophaga granulosa TaxID=45242 RepID=UPI0028D38CDB|nr:hypothetical protein [Capnocytophaga granulosa]
MKRIILILLLGIYSSAFAQNKIEGLWYLFDLFGEKPSMEMFRLERKTQERSGYRIELDKDKTFLSSSFAACGNSGTISISGSYKKIGKHYLSFHVDNLSFYGIGTEREKKDTDLGKYYVHLSAKGILYLIKSTGDLDQDKQLAQDAEQFGDLYPIIRYIFKHNGGYTPYNPSFREEITTYAAQVLKLAHYKVCLQLSVRRIIGNIGLVKDLDTGTYYYVVQDTSAQKENEFFHFTSEELKSEK